MRRGDSKRTAVGWLRGSRLRATKYWPILNVADASAYKLDINCRGGGSGVAAGSIIRNNAGETNHSDNKLWLVTYRLAIQMTVPVSTVAGSA